MRRFGELIERTCSYKDRLFSEVLPCILQILLGKAPSNGYVNYDVDKNATVLIYVSTHAVNYTFLSPLYIGYYTDCS